MILLKKLDSFLDGVTMYRLVIYGLFALVFYSILSSLFGHLAYSWIYLIYSLIILLSVTFLSHTLYAYIYKAPANIESSLITGLILFLIIAPPESIKEMAWVALLAFISISSKYVVAWKNKHIFNPVAFALVFMSLIGQPIALWWVGTLTMLPVVVIVGALVVRKIRRASLFFVYIAISTLVAIFFGLSYGEGIFSIVQQHFISWPTIFFASIMLTEPFTTPPTKKFQIMYGVIVGFVSSVPFSLGIFYSSPEMALLIGNIFSYVVSMRSRLVIVLKERITLAQDTYEFVFTKNGKLPFVSGEYMEWTLPHSSPDLRGIRRYFTIASSPLSELVRLGVKMAPAGMIASSFKQKLMNLVPGDYLNVTAVAGDFILPQNKDVKIVFIAGGIGITPFVSMLRFILQSGEKRNIILFYCNKTVEEIAYQNLLDEAVAKGTLKVIHILNDKEKIPATWNGESGFLTKEMFMKHVSDPEERKYYLSGPHGMVEAYKHLLVEVGISGRQIKTDYFPGFA